MVDFTKYFLVFVLLVSCKPITANQTNGLGFADEFVSDIPLLEEKHLYIGFWTGSNGSDKTIMSKEQIRKFNKNNIAAEKLLYDIFAIKDILGRSQLTDKIRSVSKISKYPRIYEDGTKVSKQDFARYESLLGLENIKEQNPVKFGLVVRRSNARTYPTDDLLFSEDAKDRDIDRFQETVFFPGEAVAILHQSKDGNWLLVQNYNYIAWVNAEHIAIGNKREIIDYVNNDNFLIVTGDKVRTVFNPVEPRVSELQLDMGVRLPLSRPKNLANNLYGQNPYLAHMVLLPVREADGSLAFKHALISRKQDVSIGYLDFTRDNIIRQSFKFLGERYGWGHRFNGRDCTGFIGEIYKSFGILLPRNSGDQAKSAIGKNIRFSKDSRKEEKTKAIRLAKPGDLIYIPGHVVMVLGHDGDELFVIHDVHGLAYIKPDGSFYKGILNGVSVTPFMPLRTNKETRYFDKISVVKSILP